MADDDLTDDLERELHLIHAPWDEWLASKDPDTAARAVALRALMVVLDAPDPEGWVRSEIDENIAQITRFLVLQLVAERSVARWRDVERIAVGEERAAIASARFLAERAGEPLDETTVPSSVVRQVLDTGVDPELLGRFATHVAFDAVFSTLHTIDEGYSEHDVDGLPGWVLLETTADGALTGRDVVGLHESIYDLVEPLLDED